MKRILIVCSLLLCFVVKLKAQTMHSIIFANKEEPERELDRTAEYNNMSRFCSDIALSIGYRHDLRCHSGAEFTSVMAEKEIQNLSVGEKDIVLFYYDGHGCNWDDDEWPHMAFLDKQYGETMLFDNLTAACEKAKLVLLIAGCCNMDSEGQKSGGRNRQYGNMDASKLKMLFTGFDKRLFIKSSASRRGQYSYSITQGPNAGNVYAISIRNAIMECTSSQYDGNPTWDEVMDKAAEYAYKETIDCKAGPQQPQHKIEYLADLSTPSAKPTPKQAQTPAPTPTPVGGNMPEAKINKVRLLPMNLSTGGYLSAAVDLETHYMNEDGGKLVAFVFDKELKSLEFGTHYVHNRYTGKMILIDASKVLQAAENGEVQLQVGVYDYKQKKYIAYSDKINVNVR